MKENDKIIESNIDLVLTLIRHGSTRLNDENKYIGRTDEGLSEKGIQALEKKVGYYPDSNLYFVSPMLRCRQTAKILFPHVYDKWQIIEEWKEINFGAFEGRGYEETSEDPLYNEWIASNCRGQIPDGEILSGFIDRVILGFEKCVKTCDRYAQEENRDKIRATAVIHGGCMMALLSTLNNTDYFDYNIKNGEGYELHFTGEKLVSCKAI